MVLMFFRCFFDWKIGYVVAFLFTASLMVNGTVVLMATARLNFILGRGLKPIFLSKERVACVK